MFRRAQRQATLFRITACAEPAKPAIERTQRSNGELSNSRLPALIEACFAILIAKLIIIFG